jgi:uncharacterized protein (TIGR03067 family)
MEELRRLDGMWRQIKVVRDGEALSPVELEYAFAFHAGEVSTYQCGDLVATSRITLDPGFQPKWIHERHVSGPLRGKVFVGIYKLEGDTLTVCWGFSSPHRPLTFQSTQGSGTLLVVLRRQDS